MNLFKKTTLIIKLITKHYMRRGFLLLTIVVSLLSCNNNVEGVYNGHEYVDLGLSVMWSTTNVGAELSEDYGDYYAWGETQVKQSYSWTNYKYRISGNDFDNVKLSKYNEEGADVQMILESSDDVANKKWGAKWRIPTSDEIYELMENCSWKIMTQNGVRGYLVTSKIAGFTDRTIFLPFAGNKLKRVAEDGEAGYYWSSSSYEAKTGQYLNINAEHNYSDGMDAFPGFTVRPVFTSKTWDGPDKISLNKNNITLKINESIRLKTIIKKGDIDYSYFDVSWSSSNDKVVLVENNGVIKGLSKGNAIVKASFNGLSVTCDVIVEDYKPSIEAVDLGLSVKWGSSNIGADAPEQYGYFYAWGETEPKTSFSWDNYKYRIRGNSNDDIKLSKYNREGSDDNIVELQDDAANNVLGGKWRIPSLDELYELRDNCTWTWCVKNGVSGFTIKSNKAGYENNTIFLPAVGSFKDINEGRFGSYWLNSKSSSGFKKAEQFTIVSPDVEHFGRYIPVRTGSDDCYNGHVIRPICP